MFKVNRELYLPEDVKYIIQKLMDNNYEAYLVGGCVRDFLENCKLSDNDNSKKVIVHDYDITTNAKPEEVIELFKDKKVILTGLKHGTVTVRVNGENYEVTTYRIESDYSDFRHPDKVEFVSSIEEDLSRRDFTINAIAYNPLTKEFVDPFEGIKDIGKCIRCVGNPEDRFKEDPLRILRGIRLAMCKDLSIQIKTSQEMREYNSLLQKISKERITDEFRKIISGTKSFEIYAQNNNNQYWDNVQAILENIIIAVMPIFYSCYFYVIGLDNRLDVDEKRTPNIWCSEHFLWDHLWNVCGEVLALSDKPDFVLAVAALCHDLGKLTTRTKDENYIYHFYKHPEESVRLFKEKVLPYLALSNEEISEITTLIKYHDMDIAPTKKSIRKALQKMSPELLKKLLILQEADKNCHTYKYRKQQHNIYRNLHLVSYLLDEVLKDNKECFTLKQLAINGNDLLELGIPQGKDIGKILNVLLNEVVEGNLKNTKEVLLSSSIIDVYKESVVDTISESDERKDVCIYIDTSGDKLHVKGVFEPREPYYNLTISETPLSQTEEKKK